MKRIVHQKRRCRTLMCTMKRKVHQRRLSKGATLEFVPPVFTSFADTVGYSSVKVPLSVDDGRFMGRIFEYGRVEGPDQI